MMTTTMLTLLDRLMGRLRVIADPTDDTITFSRALCRRTRVFDKESASTLVFRTPDGCYNFCFADEVADLSKDAATWPLQYNTQYNTVGFSCPEPTVNRIFYDYGLDAMQPRQLRVTVHHLGDMTYYKLHADRSRPFTFKIE